MSFVSPPELELVVESKLEGHSVPQLNRIIGIQVLVLRFFSLPKWFPFIRLLLPYYYFQLRRRINRKFVMPFYKIRSKPFLPTHHMINLNDDANEIVPIGKLHISVLSLTRIAKFNGSISCTLLLGYFLFSIWRNLLFHICRLIIFGLRFQILVLGEKMCSHQLTNYTSCKYFVDLIE